MRLIAGFTTAPTWLSGQGWRRSDSRVEELLSGMHVVEAVQRAEAAGFDVALKPDALTLPFGHIGHDPTHLGLEPIVQLAQLAGATRTIGLVATVSATFCEPYPLARQLVSLEHLAPGRIGWNVVTSRSGDEQHSIPRLPDAVARWRRAEELVGIVESLRAGFPAEALVADRATGALVDTDRVRASNHVGACFSVAGPLTLPSPTPRPLPLMVSGGGGATVAFAGRRADAVFASAVEIETSVAQRTAIRAVARDAARTGMPRLLPGLSLLLADSHEEAAAIEEATYPDPERRAFGPHWSIVGTPDDAVTAIAKRAVAGAIDGFIAFPVGSWRSVELLCDVVMPRLRRLGLVGDGDMFLGHS